MVALRRLLLGFLLVVACLAARPALADQTDPTLGGLFANLRAAKTPEAAQDTEAAIWSAWGQSHDPAVDRLMALGSAALQVADYPAALAAFDRVVAVSPRFAEGWNKRATTLYLLGRYEDSARDIDRVLALEPRHFGALSGLSLCDIKLKRTQDALAALRRAQAIDPNMPNIDYNIHELTLQLERESI